MFCFFFENTFGWLEVGQDPEPYLGEVMFSILAWQIFSTITIILRKIAFNTRIL